MHNAPLEIKYIDLDLSQKVSKMIGLVGAKGKKKECLPGPLQACPL